MLLPSPRLWLYVRVPVPGAVRLQFLDGLFVGLPFASISAHGKLQPSLIRSTAFSFLAQARSTKWTKKAHFSV